GPVRRLGLRGAAAEIANNRQTRLRHGPKRRKRGGTADQREELAAVHYSITSSARSAKNVQNPSPSMGEGLGGGEGRCRVHGCRRRAVADGFIATQGAIGTTPPPPDPPHQGGGSAPAGRERDGAGAKPHSMTSSARAKIAGGTVRPSALAVLRLTTSSKLVDCWTGRSAGVGAVGIFPAELPRPRSGGGESGPRTATPPTAAHCRH